MRKLSPQEKRQVQLFAELLPLPFFVRPLRPVFKWGIAKFAAVITTPYDLTEDASE